MKYIMLKRCSTLIFAAYFFGWSGLATIVQLSDLHTMAKRSDMVAHGYVGDQEVVEDDLGRLITLTTIEVIDGLYGAKTGELITVYQVGGQKNGLVMPLLGGHQYSFGQELILFGLKLGDTFVSYGAGQGKLDVIDGPGPDKVVEDLGDISAINIKSGRRGEIFQPSPLTFSSTSILKDEIKEMLKTK